MMISRRPRRPHAIVLSAGQGRRLLPLTADTPKCLLPVDGDRTVLDLQLETLAACDITNVTVMVGFGREQVEAHLAVQPKRIAVRTRYNPFYAVSDNLVTCWLASSEMRDDFVLLNGDTIFESTVLERALARSTGPVTVTVDRKPVYDADDMKVVTRRDSRLVTVGKTIPSAEAQGEAIGLSVFRGVGCYAFRRALEHAVRDPDAVGRWYLDVIAKLAHSMPVNCASIEGLWWCEIDTAEDLAGARDALTRTREERRLMRAVARA